MHTMAKMQTDVGLCKEAFYGYETFQTPATTEWPSLRLDKCVRQKSHNWYENKTRKQQQQQRNPRKK